MNGYNHSLETINAPPLAASSLERIIHGLLIGLFAFMPLAFGAVQAWSEQVVITVVCIILLLTALRLLYSGNNGLVKSWTYVPISLFVLLTILQLTPLPSLLLNILSPNTVAVNSQLLAEAPGSQTTPAWLTLTFYPNATRHQLRILLAGVAVYFVVLNIFKQPKQIKRLLTCIALIGAGVSTIALAQNIFGNGKIYWMVPIRSGQAHSGPFVNHSHFAQFANMSIGAALAVIAVGLHEHLAGKKNTTATFLNHLSSKSAGKLWLMIAAITISLAAVFVSLSRGGIISMLAAALVTGAILIRRHCLGEHVWLVALVALGAFACVLYTGFDAVSERLASVWHVTGCQTRWQILKDLRAVFRQFPLLGTGLGTHRMVYSMFSNCTTPAVATHAENEFAQVMAETGLLGLASVVWFGAILLRRWIYCIRHDNKSINIAAYGIGFALLAVAIHSLTDFGQHLPANALTSAALCALLINLKRQTIKGSPLTEKPSPSGLRRTIVFIGLCGVCFWAVGSANSFRRAESHWKKVLDIEKPLMADDWQGTDSEYQQIIHEAQVASYLEPDNIEYRYWQNTYKWRQMARDADPKTGELLLLGETQAKVEAIVADLLKSTGLCPIYGPAYVTAGELQLFVLENPEGSKLIETGHKLAPCDPAVCFTAGLVDVENERFDESLHKFQRAIQLDGSWFEKVSAVYLHNAQRPDLALVVAGDIPGRIAHILGALQGADIADAESFITQTRTRLKDVLQQICNDDKATASEFVALAGLYRDDQNYESAAELYRKALADNYSHPIWRLDLARTLAALGRFDDALDQTRICLRLNPGCTEAKELIAELCMKPLAAKTTVSTAASK